MRVGTNRGELPCRQHWLGLPLPSVGPVCAQSIPLIPLVLTSMITMHKGCCLRDHTTIRQPFPEVHVRRRQWPSEVFIPPISRNASVCGYGVCALNPLLNIRHTLVVINLGDFYSLDFLKLSIPIPVAESSSALGSIPSQSSPTQKALRSRGKGLGVGVTITSLVILVLLSLTCLLWRRKRSYKEDVSPTPSLYTLRPFGESPLITVCGEATDFVPRYAIRRW